MFKVYKMCMFPFLYSACQLSEKFTDLHICHLFIKVDRRELPRGGTKKQIGVYDGPAFSYLGSMLPNHN